ncbi:hypothetical protein K438DRAFT_1812495 [Mycena galopus ATCC 62051]|nr:hypothetical protein K438DRAFT_1812495 [Mycena galopus ATCC 62051]
MTTSDTFQWFVYGFGNMETLDTMYLNPWDMVLLDSTIGLIVQIFYCWRIYVLRKSLVVPAPISLISLANFAGGITTAVKAYQLGKLSLIPTMVVEQTIWMVESGPPKICRSPTRYWET